MSHSFCSLPWIHLATHPHGGLTLCCQSEMEKGLSAASNQDGSDPMTLNGRTIDEMINSKTFKEVRLSMLKGEFHPACGPCWSREKSEVISKRMIENDRFPLSIEKARLLTKNDGSIAPDIQFAELRLGNTCNVKCITCNPNSSIQHVREHQELKSREGMDFLRDYSWVSPRMSDWTESEAFWNDLFQNAVNLKEVYINGGEPMLIKRHVGFLKKLVESKQASSIRLTYSINMTKLLEELRPLWDEFKEVHFACSIDDLDQRNFYIRYPSVWKTVTENFGKLKEWGFHPHVLQTVSVLNFFYLDEFYTKWQEMFPGTVIALNDVTDPPWFSPLVLPPGLRREILVRLKATLPWNLSEQIENMYGGNEHYAEQWSHLKRHLSGFDEYREMDVRDYFPEFEKFLNSRQESLR